MTDELSIVIADDHPLFRKGVAEVIRGDATLNIVGEASDGDAALQMIRRLQPRIAVLDVEMPRLTGLEVARSVAEAKLPVSIVLLTVHTGSDLLERALQLGVRGYVSKESAVDEIVSCLHLVASGRTYISASFGPATKVDLRPPAPGLAELTAAERRVLSLIARNRSTRDIAGELAISAKTVENHRSNICLKLGITGNNALVRWLMENRDGLGASPHER